MVAYTKTVQSELKIISTLAAGAVSVTTSTLVISTEMGVNVFMDYAPDSSAAKIGTGTEFAIQTSQTTSGDDTWRTLLAVPTGVAAPKTGNLSSATTAGGTVVNTTSTLPSVGNFVFLKHTTLASSEWAEVVKTTSASSFQVRDGLTTAQTTDSTWTNGATHWAHYLNAAAVVRLRVAANNNLGSVSTGNQACIWRVAAITADSITT